VLIAVDFARQNGKTPHRNFMKPHTLQWVVAALGEDFNWWLKETSAETVQDIEPRGILDPRQVAHLRQILEEYRQYGLRPEKLRNAFQMFALESEIAEGQARLAAIDQTFDGDEPDLFALPVCNEDGAGAYEAFLDALSAAHIRKLNTTHHYARPCSTDEMDDELDALDSDRYFSAKVIHVFDEINEILEWSPAEWDDTSSSS
jgi:hypothetical protein